MLKQAFGKASIVLVYKCRVSRAGKGQKSTPVALIYRLLVSEARKKEAVAVTTALWCSGQRGCYRWGCALLTAIAEPLPFPKLAAHLERSNSGIKIIPPSFSQSLRDTQRSISHHLWFRSFYKLASFINCIFFPRVSKVIITVREFVVFTTGLFAIIT